MTPYLNFVLSQVHIVLQSFHLILACCSVFCVRACVCLRTRGVCVLLMISICKKTKNKQRQKEAHECSGNSRFVCANAGVHPRRRGPAITQNLSVSCSVENKPIIRILSGHSLCESELACAYRVVCMCMNVCVCVCVQYEP